MDALNHTRKLTDILCAVDDGRVVLSWREQEFIDSVTRNTSLHKDVYPYGLSIAAIHQNHIDQILCLP